MFFQFVVAFILYAVNLCSFQAVAGNAASLFMLTYCLVVCFSQSQTASLLLSSLLDTLSTVYSDYLGVVSHSKTDVKLQNFFISV